MLKFDVKNETIITVILKRILDTNITRCTSMKYVLFFLKKRVKFGRMKESALLKVSSIACRTFFPFSGNLGIPQQ